MVAFSTALVISIAISIQAADTESTIEQHRKGKLVIRAKPGAHVSVEQVRHEFWFGSAISSSIFSGHTDAETKENYLRVFEENFNAGVTENAVKWPSMERERGKVEYGVVDRILEWGDFANIPVRGHCVFWGIEGRVQDWIKELDDTELHDTLESRAKSVANRYRGRIPEYDLNNEMIHGNYYEKRLGSGITAEMASWFKEEDPDATLYVNDYDVLTGNRLEDYVAHIRGLLDQGVPIGGIGVQGHLHGDSFDADELKHALDTLAQFGLPIRITEFNFPGQRSRYYQKRDVKLTEAEEQTKAQALVDYFRICFAHPAVEGILFWGFWEGANWIPQSALWRRDWSPTPAAEAYRDLVFREWWTKWDGTANEGGLCEVDAFYGEHLVKTGGRQFSVQHSQGTTEINTNEQ